MSRTGPRSRSESQAAAGQENSGGNLRPLSTTAATDAVTGVIEPARPRRRLRVPPAPSSSCEAPPPPRAPHNTQTRALDCKSGERGASLPASPREFVALGLNLSRWTPSCWSADSDLLP